MSTEWITPQHGGINEQGQLLYAGRPLDLEPKPWGWERLAQALREGMFVYVKLEPGDGTAYKMHIGLHNEQLFISLWERAFARYVVGLTWERERAAIALSEDHVWTHRFLQVWLAELDRRLYGVL